LSRDFDDDDDFDGDFDDDFEDDLESSDASDDVTAPCPFCGEAIYDDAERCPACGKYLSREDAPAGQQPLWVVVGVIVCLAIVILWAVFG
jgi:hypothetical protein